MLHVFSSFQVPRISSTIVKKQTNKQTNKTPAFLSTQSTAEQAEQALQATWASKAWQLFKENLHIETTNVNYFIFLSYTVLYIPTVEDDFQKPQDWPEKKWAHHLRLLIRTPQNWPAKTGAGCWGGLRPKRSESLPTMGDSIRSLSATKAAPWPAESWIILCHGCYICLSRPWESWKSLRGTCYLIVFLFFFLDFFQGLFLHCSYKDGGRSLQAWYGLVRS